MNHRTLSVLLLLAFAGPIAQAGPGPSIKAIWPDAHLFKMYVTVEGANLGGATRVTIGGLPATFMVKGGTIHAMVPTYAVSGHVEVVTPDGKAVSKGWVEGPPLGGVFGNE